MKLANKKNLSLNVAGTLPRSSMNLLLPTFPLQPNNSIMQQQSQQQQQHSLTNVNATALLKDTMAKVVEGIYVGSNATLLVDYMSALDKRSLERENITHIVNCSPNDCANRFEDEITYLNINIVDNWRTNLFLVIYVILDFLRDTLDQGGSVLIHCNQGISRSPSIVIAYLIYTEKIDAMCALQKLKLKYPFADPNLDFQIQLNEMYQEVLLEQQAAAQQQSDEITTATDEPLIAHAPTASSSSCYSPFSSPKSSCSSTFSSICGSTSLAKRNLRKQIASSRSITVSTPDLPLQKLDYDSYLKRQSNPSSTTHMSFTKFKSPMYGSMHLAPNRLETHQPSLPISRSVLLPAKATHFIEASTVNNRAPYKHLQPTQQLFNSSSYSSSSSPSFDDAILLFSKHQFQNNNNNHIADVQPQFKRANSSEYDESEPSLSTANPSYIRTPEKNSESCCSNSGSNSKQLAQYLQQQQHPIHSLISSTHSPTAIRIQDFDDVMFTDTTHTNTSTTTNATEQIEIEQHQQYLQKHFQDQQQSQQQPQQQYHSFHSSSLTTGEEQMV